MKIVDENLSFDETKHLYFLRGRVSAGVTNTLSKTGITDFGSVDRDILDRASKFGRAVHTATELWDRKVLDLASLDEPLVPYLDAWKAFLEAEVKEILHIELPVYSLKYNFAGTIDRIYFDKQGRLCLGDIKTSGVFNAGVPLQTAGYQLAFEEMFKKMKVARRVGVILKGDGTYLPEVFADRSDRDDFLACLRVAAYKFKCGLK